MLWVSLSPLHLPRVSTAATPAMHPRSYHYGYYLSAAAAIGRGPDAQSRDFLSNQRDNLLALVRDFANPLRGDPLFPFARHMDWWGGHSWAGGFTAMGDGKNQESTSEAVNGYAAVALLGQAMGDEGLARWGRLLTAMEVNGAQTYYQSTPERSVYPEPFRSSKTVGILWSSKGRYPCDTAASV